MFSRMSSIRGVSFIETASSVRQVSSIEVAAPVPENVYVDRDAISKTSLTRNLQRDKVTESDNLSP